MINKNYIRSGVQVGGSAVLAIPPPFLRRKNITYGNKMLVRDEGDTIIIRCLDETALAQIRDDEKLKYRTNQKMQLKIQRLEIKQKKIDKMSKEKVKWQRNLKQK